MVAVEMQLVEVPALLDFAKTHEYLHRCYTCLFSGSRTSPWSSASGEPCEQAWELRDGTSVVAHEEAVVEVAAVVLGAAAWVAHGLAVHGQ